MDGSLHKVQSVTGRGASRQGIQGPAGALLRLIDLNFQEGITKVIPSFLSLGSSRVVKNRMSKYGIFVISS